MEAFISLIVWFILFAAILIIIHWDDDDLP